MCQRLNTGESNIFYFGIFIMHGAFKFENRFGSTDTFKMGPLKEKWHVPFFSKCRNSGNNSRNCTIFGAQKNLGCPFNFVYFDLGVTSRDLAMT